MEENANHQDIIEKLTGGMQFGLFDDGNSCYFQDGHKVHYADLWKALREVHHLGDGVCHKTLAELCTNTFVGTFSYKFSKHKWKK